MAGANRGQYIRAAEFDVGEFLSRFSIKSRKIASIAVNQKKYQFGTGLIKFFLKHGTKCAYCGRKGTIFALECPKNDTSWQINLYHVNRYGHQMLMNRDHIVPRCQGGTNSHDNLVTCCRLCNKEKGNKLPYQKWEPKFARKHKIAMIADSVRIIEHSQGMTIIFENHKGTTYSFSIRNDLANTLIHNIEAILQDKLRTQEDRVANG